MSRMRLLLGVISLCILSGCSGVSGGNGNGGNPPNQPSQPSYDSISGTVTFKGAPLSGATVTNFLTNENRVAGLATTDGNGHYSFTGLGTGGNVPSDYQIYVNKAGYAFYPSVGNGAQILRSDYTGQYVSVGVVPSGLLFTVIDYLALPNASLTGANFSAYDGTNPLVTLPATGQKVSYAAGDDASLHRGVAWVAEERFTANQDGTVTDNLTGLVWLKDAGCLGSAIWSDGLVAVHQLASGACGLSDGSVAGDWRVPNLVELESLIDVSQSNPALSAGHPFTNLSTGIYWTSTSYYGGQGGSSAAWTIRLSDGRYMNDSNSNIKATASNVIWAVRGSGSDGLVQLQATGFSLPYAAGDDGTVQSGVRLTSPRFIDGGNGTVTDSMTGLVWLKQADCIQGQWTDAIAVVNALGNGQCGLTDGSVPGQWRMPNRKELQSVADRMQTNQAQYFDHTYFKKDNSVYQAPIFTNYIEAQYYWTSTTNAADSSEAWTVYSCDFGVYDIPKDGVGYALAVR